MPHRIGQFVSAVLASSIVSLIFTAGSNNTAQAVDACLSAPKSSTPEGSHWYYRVERGTKRHCWYLADEHDKRSKAENSAQATQPLEPSVANAHAELTDAAASVEQPIGTGNKQIISGASSEAER